MSSTAVTSDLHARRRSPGLWALASRRFLRDRVGVVSFAVVLAFLVLTLASALGLIASDWGREVGVSYARPVFIGPDRAAMAQRSAPAVDTGGTPLDIAIEDPLASDLAEIRKELAGEAGAESRSATLPFGGDKWGRDVLKKTVKGTQTSLLVGLAAAVLAAFLGTVFGAYAGYFGGRTDDFFNWVYSVFTSIPYLLLILAIAAVLNQKGASTVVLILGLTGWTGIFRLVRAEYLKHKVREYVRAADAIGVSDTQRMFVHILPNASHVVLVQLSLHVVAFIKSEVILSFLGFGVGVETVSWGSMLNEAQNELLNGVWWQLAAATIAMAVLVTAFSLFTDALRDALDPAAEVSSHIKMPAEETGSLLDVRRLSVDFRIDDETKVRAVDGISFQIPERTTVALVGESGSGKSVTALAIMGLLPRENASVAPESAIMYSGQNVLAASKHELQALRGREISMIFQEPMSSLNPVFTVGFQLKEVLTQHMRLSRRAAHARAIELLDEVGIPAPQAKLGAYPHELSGGQQQRVMIAMAIACEPTLLIADEPTTALDVTVQKQVLELIAVLQARRGMSVLFITHDLAVVSDIADRVVVMREGTIREQGALTRVFDAPQDPYTRALLACWPRPSLRPLRLPVIDDFLDASRTREPFEQRRRGLDGSEPAVLEARHLAKSFYRRVGLLGKEEEQAVKDATFRLHKGKTLGLVGESGSGKTTVALMLVRLLPPTRGEVIFDGADLVSLTRQAMHAFKRRIQIVFQNPYASLNPRFTTGQILLEPMQVHGIGYDAREQRDLAYDMLDKVGLPADSFFKYPHEFSGGQRQRIAIARCLTMRPEVLILDESVSALDVSIQAQLLNLLQDLQDEYGMSYLFISHDLAVVRYMSDEIMVMNAGEIVEIGDSDQIYTQPRHPYTRKLLSSMPDMRRVTEPAA